MNNAYPGGDFWHLPPSPELVSTSDLAGCLLRKVRVDPVAMARALVLIKSFAARHGIGEEEEQRIAIFVREEDILLAADWDRGRTHTVDGRERPFRFRYFVPIIESVDGLASSAGAYIRPQDLQEAFRNRVENSENYGILSDSQPVTLEVFASDGSEDRPLYPARIVVHPTEDNSLEPRVVHTLAGASLSSFEDIEPKLADEGFPDLSVDAMIELAAFAEPEIGVRIHPWQYNLIRVEHGDERVVSRQGAYLVAIGRTGVAIATFDSPLQDIVTRKTDADGAQQQLFKDGQEIAADYAPTDANDGMAPAKRVLAGDLVCSPRFLHVLGNTQAAFEEVKRARERVRNADRDVKVMAATIAATLDILSEERRLEVQRMLYRLVGEPLVASWANQATPYNAQAAVRFARALTRDLPPQLMAEVAEELESIYGPANIQEVVRQQLRAELKSDSAAVRIAALIYSHGGAMIAPTAAEIVGMARIRHAARDLAVELMAKAEEFDDEFQYSYADFALATVRAANRDYIRLAERATGVLNESEYHSWWPRLVDRLRELELPDDVIQHVAFQSDGVTLRTGLPDVQRFRSTPKMREAWTRAAQVPVQGRIWRGADGRAYAGFGDDAAGWVLISDLAINPNPDHFPLSHEEVRALLATESDSFEWESRFHSNDLQAVVNRVVGLANPDSDGEDPQALLIARWTPPMHEKPDGDLADRVRTFPRGTQPLTPRTVFIEDGVQSRRFEIERSGEETNIQDPSVAGTLRIYGFEDGGEFLWFNVPIEEGPRVRDAKSAYVFALDADRLHDVIGFIADKGRKTILSAQRGILRVRDHANTRSVFLPTVTVTQVPERFRAILAAAGAPTTLEKTVPVRDVIERACQLRGSRPVLTTAAPGVLYEGDVDSIIWEDSKAIWLDRSEPDFGFWESVPDLIARLRVHKATLARMDQEREARRRVKDVYVMQTDLLGETPVIQAEKVQTLRDLDAKRYIVRKKIKEILAQLTERVDLPEEDLLEGPFHKGMQHVQVATASHLALEGEAESPTLPESSDTEQTPVHESRQGVDIHATQRSRRTKARLRRG